MRVIAGEFRSRRLKSVPGLDTRPTPDRLRETLFDILALRIEGAVFLDGYAGTGAVGIEALSRGAARVIFIERSKAALAVLRENLKSLNLLAAANIITGKVAAALGQCQADIVFLDPPYESEREYAASMEALGASGPPLVVVQHATRFDIGATHGRLHRTRVVKQGDNCLSFFEPQ
jgi:16S rRNA (guanine(966)-N(2))-methyltransferase RsmD